MAYYQPKLAEQAQYLLEPVQRQDNIILSLTSWLEGLQYVANTFSFNIIPDTNYLAYLTSSKGAFEYYLNNEFNIATYSAYQPIFIGNLTQDIFGMYGFNSPQELEYEPLYFLQPNPPQQLSGLGVAQYNDTSTFQSNAFVFFNITAQLQYAFQNFTTQSVGPGVPPIQNGLFVNTNVWQVANYGSNGLVSTQGGQDVDFIVWVPTYLNPLSPDPTQAEFHRRITAFVEKYKMAHLNFLVDYY
jgi:hypothetical protein